MARPAVRILWSSMLVTTLVFCLAEKRVKAQSRESDIEDSRAHTALIVEDIRPKLFGELSGDEKRIYSEIGFSVTTGSEINAYASREHGVRRVVLTEAIGRATELNTDAFLMDQMYHKPGFLGAYLNFVCTRYQTNDRRASQGMPPERIPSPYDFAHWADADLTRFYADPAANHARVVAVGGAFAFLLAHEVGHHVKGHVDRHLSALSKAERRDLEAEADAWAIDLMVRKRLNPVDGIIPMLFSFFNDQHPVEHETLYEHPADERRLLKMYEGLSDRLPSFAPYLQGQDLSKVSKQVDLSISLIKQEIAAAGNSPAGATQTRRSSGTASLQSEENDPLCDDLKTYTADALNNFASLRGRRDPDSDGEAFYAKRGISGFKDCEIWIYRDKRLEPSASCDAVDGSIETLRGPIQACIGSAWSSSARNGSVTFEGPGSLNIRLSVNRRGTTEIWVSSPSREP